MYIWFRLLASRRIFSKREVIIEKKMCLKRQYAVELRFLATNASFYQINFVHIPN